MKQPTQAKDSDLAGAGDALRRAARRAREVAARTRTPLVTCRDGEVVHQYVSPAPEDRIKP